LQHLFACPGVDKTEGIFPHEIAYQTHIAKASMTPDTYADLFNEDLDEVADRLNAAIESTADGLLRAKHLQRPELRKRGGAKGIRTPDLLDANETRYQLRHSPLR
jgi:hypothetical protein